MTVLQEVMAALHHNDIVVRNNAIKRFDELYRKRIIQYAIEKYEDEKQAVEAIDNAFATAIEAILSYAYQPNEDEIVSTLKQLIAIPFYEQKLYQHQLQYINQQKNSYLSVEKKLKQRHELMINLLSDKTAQGLTHVGVAKKWTANWVVQQVFDTYLFKLIGKDDVQKRNRLLYFKRMFQDKYCLLQLSYGTEIEQEKAQNQLFALCKSGIASLPNFDADVFSESMTVLLSELKQGYFIPKSTLKDYWSGIYKMLFLENRRVNKSEFVLPSLEIKHNRFSKEEVFAFILEGIDAIKYVHAGKARTLLLTARNQHFTRLIQEAVLGFVPTVETVKAMPPVYEKKTSEAQQRQDCKKALIAWMRSVINDPESNWYGSRGLAIVDFILQKES